MNTLELKKLLFKKTKCDIQYDGWTCGTCFFSLNEKLNNKDWQTILFLRGDYSAKDLDNLPKNIPRQLDKIISLIK